MSETPQLSDTYNQLPWLMHKLFRTNKISQIQKDDAKELGNKDDEISTTWKKNKEEKEKLL